MHYPSIIYTLPEHTQRRVIALLCYSSQAVGRCCCREKKGMYELQVAIIILFVLAGFALPALGMIGLAWVIQNMFGYHRPNSVKNQPYECGMKPLQEAHVQFDIRYYLYALLFILFDIEIIFLVPWALAVHSDEIRKYGTMVAPTEIAIFIAILAVGLAYAWKKGALQWE